ncbi:MAG: ATP-binding protein [Planctomycetota bacterium]|nr:ATP-binding protein [Planctomycetota bacterium]
MTQDSYTPDELVESLLAEFLDEASQLLHRLSENLMELDHQVRTLDTVTLARNCGPLITEMFRASHSLKGLSAMLGFDDIKQLTHKLEGILDAASKNKLSFTADIVDLMLHAVDRLVAMVNRLSNPERPVVNCNIVLRQIDRLLCQTGIDPSTVCQCDIDLILPGSGAAPNRATNQRPGISPVSGGSTSNQETTRVSVERLDRLLKLSSQLADDKTCLIQTASELKRSAGADSDAAFTGLVESIYRLEQIVEGIQKCVVSLRTVPIGPLFHRFQRVVGDIARQNGKQIELVIRGEATELDKRIIDALGDPLNHLIRNSADHGIELPQARLAAGKPACGSITLYAIADGDRVVIQIADDGAGVDVKRIAAKGVELGMLSVRDAQMLSPQQIMKLVWEPGFTTTEKVTEISGRGMGMDIVRSKIEQLNGFVEIHSTPGRGSTISLELPLTLATSAADLAEIATPA